MTMHTSTLPSIQQQLENFRAQPIADPAQFTEQILESNRLTREDLSLVKSFACENNKNFELVAEILALHHQPKVRVVQGRQHNSCTGQHLVIAHVQMIAFTRYTLTGRLAQLSTRRWSSHSEAVPAEGAVPNCR